MAKKLVVIESPGKLSKYKHILGTGYEIVATMGHIRDLPAKKLSVDIKNDFAVTYEVSPDRAQVVKDIQKKAKKAEVVYICTDGDREGEGIGYHVVSILPKGTHFLRAISYSITKKDVQAAIAAAGPMNSEMVDAYECRRVLDRIAGYKTSFLVRQATGGPSAGRVQSAALRFLAEREKEIQAFVPIKYWDITAELLTDKMEKIVAKVSVPDKLKINTEELAEKICTTMKAGPVKVSVFKKTQASTKPYAPFTTSTLQQAASTYLHWTPKKTMQVAQALYESGRITYMRTDSRHIIPDMVSEMRDIIKHNFDSNYLPKSAVKYSSKKAAQEAHEAIRPTDFSVAAGDAIGNADQTKLYAMIWRRAIASQMTAAEFERILAEFSCKKYVFDAHGSKRTFAGYQAVWTYGAQADTFIPDLKVGQVVNVIDITKEEKETQPPKRFSEASSVKQMEKLGIGRPSTFASTLETLKARKYIEIKKKAIHATQLGVSVIDFLVQSDFCFVDLHFTSDMEMKLDAIAQNKSDKVTVLQDFWDRLKHDIANAKTKQQDMSKTDHVCPECKKNGVESFLRHKHSKFGEFYGCERYKDKESPCPFTAKVGEHGEVVLKEKKKIEYSDHLCPACNEKMICRKSKYGEFFGCSNYPKCKGMRDSGGVEIKPKKKKYGKSKK